MSSCSLLTHIKKPQEVKSGVHKYSEILLCYLNNCEHCYLLCLKKKRKYLVLSIYCNYCANVFKFLAIFKEERTQISQGSQLSFLENKISIYLPGLYVTGRKTLSNRPYLK